MNPNCSHFAKSIIIIDHPHFSVVLKRRGVSPESWSWEIHRAGTLNDGQSVEHEIANNRGEESAV